MKKLIDDLEYWSEIYEFNFQFWGTGNNNVFIYKGGVELTSFGGEWSIEDVMRIALDYIHKINGLGDHKKPAKQS